MQYSNDPAGSVLCLTEFGGNIDHAAEVLNLMIEQYHVEKLEGYDQMRRQKQKSTMIF